MPVSVRVRRRALHQRAATSVQTQESRITDLVADMTEQEVEEMVQELAAEHERQQVWSVWKSLHAPHQAAAAGNEKHGDVHHDSTDDDGDTRRGAQDAGADKVDMAQMMRRHNPLLDSMMNIEESRAQRQAKVLSVSLVCLSVCLCACVRVCVYIYLSRSRSSGHDLHSYLSLLSATHSPLSPRAPPHRRCPSPLSSFPLSGG